MLKLYPKVFGKIRNATPRHRLWPLMNLKGKPRQRGLIRRGKRVQVTMATEAAMQAPTLSPRALKVSALYYKK